MAYTPVDTEDMDIGTGQQNEIGQIRLRINQTADDSLESTRRMMVMAEESKEAGIKTLVHLDEQGEQLENIQKGMDKINKDMKDAEKTLEGLEKCCGLCVLPWKKTRKSQAMDYKDANWKDPNAGQPNTEGPRQVVGGQMVTTGNMVVRITDDAREDEMEENMQQVNSMVSVLKNMAVDMGNEVDSQNRAIDKTIKDAQSNETRVVEANKRANILLKS